MTILLFFAHSLSFPDGSPRPQEDWELLYTGNGEGHSEKVAALAQHFSKKFSAGPWGEVLGHWHDLGKYSEAFQNYLLQANGFIAHLEEQSRVDHATAGAQLAYRTVKPWGRILAYIIAGHHAGLADANGGRSSLAGRLEKEIPSFDAAPSHLLELPSPLPKPSLSVDPKDRARLAFQLAFFTRMLFSCLVDADFLGTEAFMNAEQSRLRPTSDKPFGEMNTVLLQKLESLAERAKQGNSAEHVHQSRQKVLDACRSSAVQKPGMFSLTVPTGGGKTLASLAFALSHVMQHKLDRVIFAIPFTSIIEQTASVYRDVFSSFPDGTVLEHHSNLDPDSKHETKKSRLAAENWDAPLVVTTNVQLFESLFAAKTSRCRKLHNLVNSVIILDEAQTLPVEMLRPALAAMRELVADYGCTIVLCTATQPALGFRDEFPIGLQKVREIIPDAPSLYKRMKRVEVEYLGELSDRKLAAKLNQTPSFLTIVNTKPHAAKLFQLLCSQSKDQEGLYHLSTLLCGEHRSHLLTEIRKRLSDNLPCRVISTQLIEAGVDVDFPVVFRAMTGLDSLAQAAGRCNREGKQNCGIVYLFDSTDCQPKGYLGATAQTAREIILDYTDLLDPEAIERYFELHYWKRTGENQWDDKDVMNCFPTPAEKFEFEFRKAAERFQMIEETTTPVLVPYGKGKNLIEQLRKEGPSRKLLRRLQRYSVGVYEQVYRQMVGSDIEELEDGNYAVLMNEDLYDKQLGLRIDLPGYHDPENLITGF